MVNRRSHLFIKAMLFLQYKGTVDGPGQIDQIRVDQTGQEEHKQLSDLCVCVCVCVCADLLKSVAT